MNRRSMHKLVGCLAISATLFGAPAMAAWPERPITLVVPYAPGGTADALARLLAQHLGAKLNTSVVVENRAGASGVIGANSVARAQPDGYTFLYDATPLSINPHLQTLPFDPQADLVPVTLVGVTPMLMLVNKSSPYGSAQVFIEAAKAAPGKLTFGSGGQGTVQYMGAELFNQGNRMQVLHIPYRSGGPFLTAIMAGEVDMGFGNVPAVAGHVKSGMLRPLAITAGERHPNFPDVPTVAEIGLKGYEVFEWNGIFAPKGTPADIVENLQRSVSAVLAVPEVKAKFDDFGTTTMGSTPADFRAYFATESAKWAETVKSAGIKRE